jgi:hypothetical protein
MAAHMMNSNKNGVSAHEIHRNLGVTYKTPWFMMHRLREAMIVSNPGPVGSEGKSVQTDETYYGNTSRRAKSYKKGHSHKEQIVALVEPGGQTRKINVKSATLKAVREFPVTNASRTSELHTDEALLYRNIGKESAGHKTVNHTWTKQGSEWVGPDGQATNAVENFFGVLKRDMRGTYTFCGAQHLRYVTEFEFRYNNRSGLGVTDGERTAKPLKGIEGTLLTYRIPH